MNNFDKWDNAFRNQNLYAFNGNENGLLWLKVRAVCRSKQIKQFLDDNDLTITSKKLKEQNVELFNLLSDKEDGMIMLDNYLKNRNNEWYRKMGVDDENLKSGLRRINNYTWGGDQENSLDQYLIRRYVKAISDYDVLFAKANEIATNSWNFVQTSWYNNWTSYLIESIFKKHKSVLSAVGEIKSVDFFIDKCPVDLKVTYFPNEYMQSKLKRQLGNTELTWLKRKAKDNGISLDKNLSDSEQVKYLKEELSLKTNDIIDFLNNKRKEVIVEAQKNPIELMKWLYENQSPRLFGAENRLFVVLVDSINMDDSWKMKRAFSVLEPKINEYLDGFSIDTLKEITFSFNGNEYKSLADIIFVVK